MNKITPEHLVRDAFVYVRQSTADQLAHNPESRRRQYALKGRAEALGWQNVVVIDDDLGRSGGGVARKGFERPLPTRSSTASFTTPTASRCGATHCARKRLRSTP